MFPDMNSMHVLYLLTRTLNRPLGHGTVPKILQEDKLLS